MCADQFKNPERPVDKPFRLSVSDVFKSATGGFSIAGRISAGYIRPGDKVMVMPAGNMAGVKSESVLFCSVLFCSRLCPSTARSSPLPVSSNFCLFCSILLFLASQNF